MTVLYSYRAKSQESPLCDIDLCSNLPRHIRLTQKPIPIVHCCDSRREHCKFYSYLGCENYMCTYPISTDKPE